MLNNIDNNMITNPSGITAASNLIMGRSNPEYGVPNIPLA